MPNRVAPPREVDQTALSDLSKAIDSAAALQRFPISSEANVIVSPGDVRRLTPRAAGMQVTVPTADGSNYGKTIMLLIEASLGTCRIRATSGTINNATAFTLAAGYTTLLILVSNGSGRWMVARASGFPTAGAGLSYSGETLNVLLGNALGFNSSNQIDYIGSPVNINVTPTAGALGIVDITAMRCGGVLSFQSVTDATIAGFTVKPDGFWFIVNNRDASTGDVITLLEDSGSVTTSIRTPDIRDLRLYKNDSIMMIYTNSRWRAVVPMTRLFLTGVLAPTWAAQQNDLARTSRGQNVIRVTMTGDQTLTGVVPDQSANGSPNGELLCIDNVDATDVLRIASENTSSAAANRFQMWDGVDYMLQPRESLWFRYDDTAGRWRPIGSNPHGRLLRRTVLTTGTAATHTLLSSCSKFIAYGVGAGGAAGGKAATAGAFGAGGGSGTYGERQTTTVAGQVAITYTIGVGGTGVSGAAGNNGTATTFTYNAVTTTFPAGAGGQTVAGGVTATAQLGGTGGGAATNADWDNGGQQGGYGARTAAATTPGFGGDGGSTIWGFGGRGAVVPTGGSAVGGTAGAGPGAGGGGPHNGVTLTASAGANGFRGQLIIEEYS